MNKTEAAYAELLELRRKAGEIFAWGFEQVRLRLAHTTFYTPDFLVIMPDNTLEFHEVKGFWREDARVKIKVAATAFPHFRFIAVTKKGKQIGAWDFEDFEPAERLNS